MTTAIIRHEQKPERIVAGIALPAISLQLREAMAHVTDPHPNVGIEPDRIPPSVREEAGRGLAVMDAVMRPATTHDWQKFLSPLRILPQAPTTAAGFTTAIGLFGFAFNDVPASVLTVDRQREALRTMRFWPVPADIERLLRPTVDALHRERRGLEAVVRAPTQAAYIAPTNEERKNIARGFATLIADLRAAAAARERCHR
jgi:hypothetical protein